MRHDHWHNEKGAIGVLPLVARDAVDEHGDQDGGKHLKQIENQESPHGHKRTEEGAVLKGAGIVIPTDELLGLTTGPIKETMINGTYRRKVRKDEHHQESWNDKEVELPFSEEFLAGYRSGHMLR